MTCESLRDPAVERAVLAAVCGHGGPAFDDVADLITPRTLTDPAHQAVWGCLARVFAADPAARVDFPTLMSAASDLGVAGTFTKDDLAVLRAVLNLPVRPENARKLAGKLRKLEVARDAVAVLDRARADLLTVTGDEPVEAILAKAEGPVLDLAASLSAQADGPAPVGQGLKGFVDHLAAHPRELVGVRTGFRWYDLAIGGGLRRGTVNVVGARTKVGKSLFAVNAAARIASGAGYDWPRACPAAAVPVLHLDTEMTRDDQRARQLACVSGVRVNDIERGAFAADRDKDRAVRAAVAAIEGWPYDFMPIAGRPFEETEAVMRRWVTRRVKLEPDGTARPCVIVFDYLKLMDSSELAARNVAEFQVLGFMMTRLHNFAVRFQVPILLFIQLNREGISVEDTSAASGSDRIVWLCSNFSIYKPQSDDEIAEQAQAGRPVVYNRKLVPVVARHGAGLDFGDYINVLSDGATATLTEGPLRSQAAPDARAAPGGRVVDDTDEQPPV